MISSGRHITLNRTLQRLLKLANQHTIIERGRMVWQGDSTRLAADPALWQRYIGV